LRDVLLLLLGAVIVVVVVVSLFPLPVAFRGGGPLDQTSNDGGTQVIVLGV
jgi:hypothetical protein